MNRETPQKDHLCGTCYFFRQYYVKLGRRYIPVDHGHCAHPAAAARRTATETCSRWTAAEPKREN